MSEQLLSEEEYQAFNNAEPGETVYIQTKDGSDYTMVVQERIGGTLRCIGVVDDNPCTIDLRGVRGRGSDDDQPAIAVGFGGPNSIETVEEETGFVELDGVGYVPAKVESGTVSYDAEAVVFERKGEQTIQIG